MDAVSEIRNADYMLRHNIISPEKYEQMVKPWRDAEPIRHGHWITKERHEHYPSGVVYYADYCSVCGRRGRKDFDGCPYCRAVMDEVPTNG